MEEVLWKWFFERDIPELAECVDTVRWDEHGVCELLVAPEHSAGVVSPSVLEGVVAALQPLDVAVVATALVDGTTVVRASAKGGCRGGAPLVLEEAPAALALQCVSCGIRITGLPHQCPATEVFRLGTSWNLAALLASSPMFSRASPFGVPRPPAGSSLAQARHQALAFDKKLQSLAPVNERWLDTSSDAGLGTVLVEGGSQESYSDGDAASVFVVVAADEQRNSLLRSCSPQMKVLSRVLMSCLSERTRTACEDCAETEHSLPCALVHRLKRRFNGLPRAALFFVRWRPEHTTTTTTEDEEYKALFSRTLSLLGSCSRTTTVKKEPVRAQATTEREECAMSLASSIAEVCACSVSTAFQHQLWNMLCGTRGSCEEVPAQNQFEDTETLCQLLVKSFLNI